MSGERPRGSSNPASSNCCTRSGSVPSGTFSCRIQSAWSVQMPTMVRSGAGQEPWDVYRFQRSSCWCGCSRLVDRIPTTRRGTARATVVVRPPRAVRAAPVVTTPEDRTAAEVRRRAGSGGDGGEGDTGGTGGENDPSCEVSCRPLQGGPCQEGTVMWTCFGPGAFQALADVCDSAPVGGVAFCCPADVEYECE